MKTEVVTNLLKQKKKIQPKKKLFILFIQINLVRIWRRTFFFTEFQEAFNLFDNRGDGKIQLNQVRI